MSGVKKTRCSSKGYNRRRFSDDQIKSLETTFETEARPELRLKQHLAGKLGLQPRQVAIWFQNKRARSKSKQLEREFGLLKSDFDHMASQYDSLKKENQTLLNQVESLRKMAETRNGDKTENRIITTSAFALSSVIMNKNNYGIKSRDDDVCIDDYLEDDDEDDRVVLNSMGQINGEQGSSDMGGGCSFESCSFLDNTTGNSSSQWWDF